VQTLRRNTWEKQNDETSCMKKGGINPKNTTRSTCKPAHQVTLRKKLPPAPGSVRAKRDPEAADGHSATKEDRTVMRTL